MHPSDFAYRFDLRLRHHRLVRPAVRHELVARRVDFERIDALADHLARRLAELLGAVTDDGESFPMHVAQAHIAQPGRRRQLGTGRPRAGPRNVAGIDGVADHDIQARLGRRRAVARGKTLLQEFSGVLGRAQRVLLGRHEAQAFEVCGVEEGQVRVGLDQPRHQRGAAAVHHVGSVGGKRRALRGNGLDAVALHQHLARERRRTRAIEHGDIPEQDFSHGLSPPSPKPG